MPSNPASAILIASRRFSVRRRSGGEMARGGRTDVICYIRAALFSISFGSILVPGPGYLIYGASAIASGSGCAYDVVQDGYDTRVEFAASWDGGRRQAGRARGGRRWTAADECRTIGAVSGRE